MGVGTAVGMFVAVAVDAGGFISVALVSDEHADMQRQRRSKKEIHLAILCFIGDFPFVMDMLDK